jgi:hypothetical protein
VLLTTIFKAFVINFTNFQNMQRFFLTFLVLVNYFANAALSETFRQFVRATYGDGSENELNRPDMGDGGSFGGGAHAARTKTAQRPVLLVHGITNKASNFEGIRQFFLTHNYKVRLAKLDFYTNY